MAGHSKWANIKRRKEAQDSKRSALFTKLIKEITVAAKTGGADPEANARLRLAVQTAKKNSVPKDVIERAINKATGADAVDYTEVVYEGYGPNGVAVVVEAATDNINRTVANVRSYFAKAGGSLGTNGSVVFMFDRKGVFTLPAEGIDEEALTLAVIDAGAEDISEEDGYFTITCPFEEFGAVNEALEAAGYETESSELNRIPTTTVPLEAEAAQKVLNMVERIEDDDDVQKVFHNLELTDELAAQLAG